MLPTSQNSLKKEAKKSEPLQAIKKKNQHKNHFLRKYVIGENNHEVFKNLIFQFKMLSECRTNKFLPRIRSINILQTLAKVCFRTGQLLKKKKKYSVPFVGSGREKRSMENYSLKVAV